MYNVLYIYTIYNKYNIFSHIGSCTVNKTRSFIYIITYKLIRYYVLPVVICLILIIFADD